MFSRVFSALSLFLLLLLSFGVERVASSPIVTTRPSPQRHDGQAPLQPTRTGSHLHIMTPTPAASQTITAAHLKRDDATTAVDESAAAALLSSSIQSVLATGLPLSILSLAATNPAAASSWIASEVLVLQQTATTTTVPTPSWYRALPTDVKAYLLAAAESMVAAAEVAATATGTAAAAGSSTSSSESETSTSTAAD
ncbi:hypothetical protein BFW01_g2017 [Lasiodiplodia theobromae]|nr:hypothetical protein BFW01_g2017 [Lasiodiplodia theobromae]